MLAQDHLSLDQIWVNPDRGLKTRGWAEGRPAITAMVDAARTLRGRYDAKDRQPAEATA